jgi:hypothetical protein
LALKEGGMKSFARNWNSDVELKSGTSSMPWFCRYLDWSFGEAGSSSSSSHYLHNSPLFNVLEGTFLKIILRTFISNHFDGSPAAADKEKGYAENITRIN